MVLTRDEFLKLSINELVKILTMNHLNLLRT